jgi:hypothetical protein
LLLAIEKNAGESLLCKQNSCGGTTMLTITILVAAAGLALGLRFNALGLALVLLLAITGICIIAIGSGTNLLVVALRALAVLVSLQISYLIGSLIAAQLPSRVNLNV